MGTRSVLTYDISETQGVGCNPPVLARELSEAGLNNAAVSRDGNNIIIDFQELITADQKAACDTVVVHHQGLPFAPTTNAYSDPSEHLIEPDGYWHTVGEFNSGPLPTGIYVLTWSVEGKVDTENLGNRIGLQVLMNGQECSRDTLTVPDWGKYQDGEWVPMLAGQSFLLTIQAKTVGCNGLARRIRAGLILA